MVQLIIYGIFERLIGDGPKGRGLKTTLKEVGFKEVWWI